MAVKKIWYCWVNGYFGRKLVRDLYAEPSLELD